MASNNENVIDVEEAYDSMFLLTKRRWNGHVLAACMRKARIVFDSFPRAVTCKWDWRASRLNSIPVYGCFEEPPSVLLGDTSIVYTNHLFHDTRYCFKQICRYMMAGFDRKNTMKEVQLVRNNTGITVGTYIFIKKLFVPLLLKLVLFGNSYNYMPDRIIFESAAKIVAHLQSAVQLNKLFTVQGLSATNVLVGNQSQYQYICCS